MKQIVAGRAVSARCAFMCKRSSDYPQTTLPKNMRTRNEGIQNPVLTFTKAAATSDHLLQATIEFYVTE
jgi:hypothetical protein